MQGNKIFLQKFELTKEDANIYYSILQANKKESIAIQIEDRCRKDGIIIEDDARYNIYCEAVKYNNIDENIGVYKIVRNNKNIGMIGTIIKDVDNNNKISNIK